MKLAFIKGLSSYQKSETEHVTVILPFLVEHILHLFFMTPSKVLLKSIVRYVL